MKKVTEILENGTHIIYRSSLDENVACQLLQGVIVGNDEENSREDLSDLNYYVLRGEDRFAKGEQGAYDEMIHHQQIIATYEIEEENISEEALQEAIEESRLLASAKITINEPIDNFELLKEKAKEFKCSKCKTHGKNIIVPSVAINGQYYVMCTECGNMRVAKEALSNEGVSFVLNETPEKLTTPAHQLLLKDAKDSFTAIGMSPDKVFMTKEELDRFKLKEEIKREIMNEVKDYIDSQLLSPEYNTIAEVPSNFNLQEDGHIIMELDNLEIYEEGASDFLVVYLTDNNFTRAKFTNCTKEQLKEEIKREIRGKDINGLFIYEILDEIDPEDILN